MRNRGDKELNFLHIYSFIYNDGDGKTSPIFLLLFDIDYVSKSLVGLKLNNLIPNNINTLLYIINQITKYYNIKDKLTAEQLTDFLRRKEVAAMFKEYKVNLDDKERDFDDLREYLLMNMKKYKLEKIISEVKEIKIKNG